MTKFLVLAACVFALLSLSIFGTKKSIESRNQDYLDQLGKNQIHFEKLIDAIHDQTPYVVYITSGHRSTAHQKILYEKNSKNAAPGSSPHEFKREICRQKIPLKRTNDRYLINMYM